MRRRNLTKMSLVPVPLADQGEKFMYSDSEDLRANSSYRFRKFMARSGAISVKARPAAVNGKQRSKRKRKHGGKKACKERGEEK